MKKFTKIINYSKRKMKMKRYKRTGPNNLLTAVIATTLVILFLPVSSIGEQMTVDGLYQKIKQLENIFPLPVPFETIKIGTYDAKTKTFKGKISVISERLEAIKDLFPGGKVPPPQMEGDYWVAWIEEKKGFVRLKRIYMPVIRAPNAILQFDIENATAPVTITANGKSVSDKRRVLIEVGQANVVNWDIERGRVKSHLEIRRVIPPNIAVGAFTVPALPITVIYEPPPDKAMGSHAIYSSTTYIGTTTEISFGTEKSTTRPVKPQGYRKTTEMQRDLRNAATVLSAAAARIPIPYASEATKALTIIADGLGKISATETIGYAEAKGTSLTLTYRETNTFNTFPNDGGPGVGDVIVYLKNVKFLWFVEGNTLKLTMLGCEGNKPKIIGVNFLKNNLNNRTATGLDPEVGRALLNLDPYVYKKSIGGLNDRYEYWGDVDQRGGGLTYTFEIGHEFSREDWNAVKNFTTRVEDYRRGWLSFLGLGVTQDETVTFTTWNQNISKTIRGEKTEVQLVFPCGPDEIYIARCFYDRIFGTFAFETVPPTQTAMLSGTATGPDGKPIAGKFVKLMIEGKPIITVTDKEGRFEFHSPMIKGGKASLVVDNKVYQEISLSPGRPISGIKLQLQTMPFQRSPVYEK